MNRRETLRLLLLSALGSKNLIRAPRLIAQESSFHSLWQDWPDMRWAGPEYWGNRLQDWSIQDGVLVCGVRAPNRTLHCLTHRAVASRYETSVLLDLSELSQNPDPTSLVGLRLGVKGPFPDFRSAAVHGIGIDVGVEMTGALRIGDRYSSERISLEEPVRLRVMAEDLGGTSRVELTAQSPNGGPTLAQLVHNGLKSKDLIGNLALLHHVEEETPGQGAVFADWEISGSGILTDPSASFGPIMFAQYTLHQNTLKLTAQLAPIESIPELDAVLDIRSVGGSWAEVTRASIDTVSRTARFRVESWVSQRDVEYRIRVTIPLTTGPAVYEYLGTVAAEPDPMDPLKAAVFSCNADHGFPDSEVVENVSRHDPDLSLFLGDQFYEGSGGFGIQTTSVEEAALDMLHKWYMFGWSYRDLFRHIPAAFIPDDHDVYHGNVWGEGGKSAPTDQGWGAIAQDQGGYKMPSEWVNVVQMAQTSHLPDPVDPTPVEQGIGVYFTRWDYAGVSFAILEDRKFKSAPANVLPEDAQVLNGWIQNPEFDVREYRDIPEASLLGERQMRFLDNWAGDWSGPSYMKVVLSQTNFASVHTIPEDAMSGAVLPGLPVPEPGDYVLGDKIAADMDSNGWPQDRRDEVLTLLQSCSAFHIAGDQHLATVVCHGIEEFGDAAFTFTGPALNNIWPRRWWPPVSSQEPPLDSDRRYTGDFFDGFGNRVTVHAAANPRASGLEPSIIRDRVTGYGIVTFDKQKESIRIECWPRHINPSSGRGQYEGWPISIGREDGDGRTPLGFLPTIEVRGMSDAVVEVRNIDGDRVYVRRIIGRTFRSPIFASETHVVRVGDPNEERWLERSVSEEEWGRGKLVFDFSV